MSTIDKASLIQIPSGYKNGKLYSVKPTPAFGSELVTNGDFSSDSDWTKGTGWSISGGKANASSATSDFTQSISFTLGKTYKVTYTISNYSSGSVRVLLGAYIAGTTRNSNGTFTDLITPTNSSSNSLFYLEALSGFNGSIDNVSVKEITNIGDFDFSRSSSATRVNSEGLIETAQIVSTTELVTNGDFATDTWWQKSSSNVNISNGKGNYTAGTTEYFYKSNLLTVGKTYKVTFEITDYTIGYISAFGGNWSSVQTGVGTNEIYFTCINANFGLVGNSFIGSIDNVSVKEVFENDVPRLDYSDGSCPSLLLEPQRTNNILQSNQLNTTWVLTNATITGNQSGIFNSTDAWKLVGNGSNNDRINSNSLSSGAYTFSIYAKAGNSKFVAVVLGSGVVYYNLESGSIGSQASVTSASIESVGNEWYRLNMSVASGSGSVQVYIANAVGSVNTSNGDFIYLQHAQAEVGSYSTSIIPTSGATATRTADVCNNAGTSATFNSTQGVVFAEIAALFDEGTTADKWIALSDGTSNNSVRVAFSGGANTIRAYLNVGGAAQADLTYTISDVTQYSKIGFKFKANDFSLWVDGTERATDTSGSVYSANTLNRLAFDNGGGGTGFQGKTKQLIVFDEALSDEELSDLTGQVNLSFNNLATFYNYTIL